MFRVWQVTAIGVLCALGASAAGQGGVAECGSLQNGYGPYDYTDPVMRRSKLPVVESGHFDAGVESLRGHAKNRHALAGDLDYTLRAFPNHHRALYAMARYYLSSKEYNRPPLPRSAECYFDRAARFAPHDGIVRLIQGIYFYKSGDIDAATEEFRTALALSPDSAEVHYNIGLAYVELDRLAEAKEHADRAYELGHPMAGLRNKLKRRGAW